MMFRRVPMCFYIHRKSTQSPFTCVRPSALKHSNSYNHYFIFLIDMHHGSWWSILINEHKGYAFTNIDHLNSAIIYFSQFPNVSFELILDKQRNHKEWLIFKNLENSLIKID